MTAHATKGFTLLEIMVSLMILMIVGILITTGLRSSINTHDILTKKIKSFTELQLAILRMENDFHEIYPKVLQNDKGQATPVLAISNNALTFMRSGIVYPNDINHSDTFQSVTYALQGSNLIRSSRTFSKKAFEKTTVNQIILRNVKSFKPTIIPNNNILTNPVTDPTKPKPAAAKIGMMIEIVSNSLGYIRRVIPIAVNSLEENTNAQPKPV